MSPRKLFLEKGGNPVEEFEKLKVSLKERYHCIDHCNL